MCDLEVVEMEKEVVRVEEPRYYTISSSVNFVFQSLKLLVFFYYHWDLYKKIYVRLKYLRTVCAFFHSFYHLDAYSVQYCRIMYIKKIVKM